MERIHTLIDKLTQQKVQGASPAQLLFTVQLLQQELLQLQQTGEKPGTRKVAVTLPFNTTISVTETIFTTPVVETMAPFAEMLTVEPSVPVVEVPTPFVETAMQETPAVEEKEIYVLEMAEEEVEEERSPYMPPPAAEQKEYILRKPVVQDALFEEPKQQMVREESRPSYVAQQLFNSAFDTTVEVPTLMQYKAAEVHEKVAEKRESLNDRLKQEKTEVVHLLKETPIKDLRKGIGINDRFAFVNELFRGDEAAYERSIKTINNFGIYSEAEYWISRELKFKLGWDDNNETVQHFYQLVRRRFS